MFTKSGPSGENKAGHQAKGKTKNPIRAITKRRAQARLRLKLAGLKRKAEQAEANQTERLANIAGSVLQRFLNADRSQSDKYRLRKDKETLTPAQTKNTDISQKNKSNTFVKKKDRKAPSAKPKGRSVNAAKPKGRSVKSSSTKRSKSKNKRFEPMVIKPAQAQPNETVKPSPKVVPKKRDIRSLFTTE